MARLCIPLFGVPLLDDGAQPRFLHQGEEIFLDALGQGHRTFLMVELNGNAPSVDIELNGRIKQQPFAARIPETLARALEES